MSLSTEFFFEQAKKIHALCEQGYTTIDDLMENYNVTKDQLLHAGIIKDKYIISTADLYDYDVTQKGKEFFKVYDDFQIIVIHKDKIDKFIDLIQDKNSEA